MSSAQATESVYCNKCGHQTRHKSIAKREQHGSEALDHHYTITWTTIYEMFECCGCEDITLRRRHYFSEWDSGDVEENYYPPRASRQLPVWRDALSTNTKELLNEVYTALHAKSFRIAMMGARTLLDIVMLECVGDVGSFDKKLDKMQQDGHIGTHHRAVIKAAVDVGNAASHRGFKPNAKHANDVLNIVENLLHTMINSKSADALKAATPPRKKVSKTTANNTKT